MLCYYLLSMHSIYYSGHLHKISDIGILKTSKITLIMSIPECVHLVAYTCNMFTFM